VAGAAARAEPRPRRSPRPAAPRERASAGARPRRAVRGRPRVRSGVLWIVFIGALLAGIVALNVAVLRLNMEGERLDGEIQELRAKNAERLSELSNAAAAGRVQAAASQLGLVSPVDTTYLRLRPAKR
jgi:hypothetical protein